MKPPSESYEQQLLVQWLDAHGYTFTSIPNAGRRTVHAQAKNKREGLRRGLPDILVVLKAGRLLWLELKRTKNSRTSPEQLAWLEALNACRTPAFVAKGCQEAIRIILEQETLAHGLVAE